MSDAPPPPPGWPPPERDDHGITFGSPTPPPTPPPGGYPPSAYPPAGSPGVGAPGYGPPPYVSYGYHPDAGGAYRAREHPQGTTILVLGILSIVLCQLLGPVAWTMGSKARREIRYAGVPITNSGMVTAGWVLGIVSSLLMIGAVLFLVLLLAAGTSARAGM